MIRFLVYIDLNMVLAGVVTHPSEWEMSGFNEIQNPPERYGVIDMSALRNLCGIPDPDQFSEQHRQWVQEAKSTVAAGRTGEAVLNVKPGHVYYLRVKVLPLAYYDNYLESMTHQEGAGMIKTYKLNVRK